MNNTLSFACYSTHNETEPTVYLKWDDLKKAVKDPATTEKEQTACLHPSNAPGKTIDVVRDNNQMTLLWADIDSGNQSLEDVKEKIQDAGFTEGFDAFLIYSTASAWREKKGVLQGGRWRVLFPLSKPTPCTEWLKLQEALTRALDGGYEAVQVHQILYLPTNPDGGRYEECVSHGTVHLDPDRLPEQLKIVLDVIEQEQAEELKQAKAAPVAARDVSQSGGGVIDKVNEAYQIEAVMADYGCREAGSKWIHPESTTGKPGIKVLDGKYYYSHHGSDPLSDGHRHDVFDLLCQWHFNGDVSAAIAHYADELDPEGQKERQREYAKNKNTVEVDNLDELMAEAKRETPEISRFLPDYPEELLNLPGCLGEIQDFIYGRMVYPSRAAAGMMAFATLTAFAQTNILIDSRDGLGFNEYYMILMPTGFGKEDLRKPVEILLREAREAITAEMLAENGGGNLSAENTVGIRHAMPPSPQGMHQLLEGNRSLMFLADEYAEWLRQTTHSTDKQAALGYTMQAYTRATGILEPGHAISTKYTPVKNPRLSIVATSTGEALLQAMNKDQGDSGAYNRMLMFAGDTELPQKRYEGLIWNPKQSLVDFMANILTYPPDTLIKFSPEGWEEFKKQDQELSEPIKRDDGMLGGRLAEQSIKMAGLLALSDRRLSISAEDIKTAFAIRVGIYHRASKLAKENGSLDGLHKTTSAYEQVVEVFEKKQSLYRSQIPAFSKKFKALSVREQKEIIQALLDNEVVSHTKESEAHLISQICPLFPD